MPHRDEDLIKPYGLPDVLWGDSATATNGTVENAKVVRYARVMPVQYRDILTPEAYAAELRMEVAQVLENREPPLARKMFTGRTVSELNRFVSGVGASSLEITIEADELLGDESLRLVDGLRLVGGGTTLEASGIDIGILGEKVRAVTLMGMRVRSPRVCGLMLCGCKDVSVENCAVEESSENGAMVRGGSAYVGVFRCDMSRNRRAGILIEDGCHDMHVSECRVVDGGHSSNWAAGIVVSAVVPVTPYGTRDSFEPNYFYPADISFKAEGYCYRILIESCQVLRNQSSGVYIDGGNGVALARNKLSGNDKEGVCLDFYAAANLLLENDIQDNGFRRRQADEDLRIDMVWEAGRLKDGSAAAKVPNISLDNAAYNLLLRNTITGGGGGGIKIVRAGFRNVFVENRLCDNNAGGNPVYEFPAILLGSSGAEMENDESGLDRLASYENLILGNIITGKHAAGILYDPGSTGNVTVKNRIRAGIGPPVVVHDQPNEMRNNRFILPAYLALYHRVRSVGKQVRGILNRALSLR